MAGFSKYFPVPQDAKTEDTQLRDPPRVEQPVPWREQIAQFPPIGPDRPLNLLVAVNVLEEVRAYYMELGYDVVVHPDADGDN